MKKKFKSIFKYLPIIAVVLATIFSSVYFVNKYVEKKNIHLNNTTIGINDANILNEEFSEEKIPSVIDKNTNTRTLQEWEIPGYQTTDGGTEVVGFYKNDKLYKVSEWVGLSFGVIYTEYHFSEGQITYIYEKHEYFPYIESKSTLDYLKLEFAFEGNYYFNKGILIDIKTKGKKTISDTGISETEHIQELVDSGKKYREAFSK